MEKAYFETEDFQIYNSDSFEILNTLPSQSIDMIFADPPYFLSNGGISCHAGKQCSVNKGSWDEGLSFSEKLDFNRKWIKLCRRVLKDDGTIWISGTFHNIYLVGVALEEEGFSIINNITWQKPNPPPNLACRSFTHSTETILWARKQLTKDKKGKHYFNYGLMKQINDNKQMKDVWELPLPSKKEKKFGKHPTQKPEGLLERIILASTKTGDVILDPFNGSGTTGVVSVKLGRHYIGIELEKTYCDLSILRYKDLKEEQKDGK